MAKHLKYLSAPFGSAIVGLPNRAGPQAVPSKYRQACFVHRRINAVCTVRIFNLAGQRSGMLTKRTLRLNWFSSYVECA